jgi:hypothetical protein
MSIAINLLPDVRLARIRAQHLKHLATGIAVAIWIIAGIIVGGLFLGIGAQKLVLDNVNNQIATDISSINSTKGLTSALTAQQILHNLPTLYKGRTYFSKFMPIITVAMPPTAHVSNVTASSSGTLAITGAASSAYVVDQFYEALKASGATSTTGAYFSNVTITSVSKDPASGAAAFNLTAVLSPGAIHG